MRAGLIDNAPHTEDQYDDLFGLIKIKKERLGRWDIRCVVCGRFIAASALAEARFHFIPDSVCGPEESDWTCKKCLATGKS